MCVSPGLLCSKFYLLCHYAQYFMPATTAIMPQFIHNLIIFNDYISIASFQAVVFYICYAAVVLYLTLLCSWENLCHILYHVSLLCHKSFYKDYYIIYKSGEQHLNKLTDNDFNKLLITYYTSIMHMLDAFKNLICSKL